MRDLLRRTVYTATATAYQTQQALSGIAPAIVTAEAHAAVLARPQEPLPQPPPRRQQLAALGLENLEPGNTAVRFVGFPDGIPHGMRGASTRIPWRGRPCQTRRRDPVPG